MKTGCALAAILAFGAMGLRVTADEIDLLNGSRLIGTVTGIQPGKVLLTTDFAGVLALDAARIAAIRTDVPLNVAFEDGRRARGTLAVEPGGPVLRTQEGALPIAGIASVKAVWREGQPEPGPSRRTWAHEAALDLAGKSGNTRKSRLGVSARSVLSGPHDKTALYIRAARATEDGEESEDETIGGADYEQTFRRRHLWYLRGEAERDDIEGVDLRTTLAGGYGYYLAKQEKQSLRGRIGLQYRREKYCNGETEESIGPELGLCYELELRPWLKLVSEATYSPGFDDLTDYRLTHSTTVDLPVGDPARHLALRLGVSNTYNSDAIEDRDKLETLYLARLVLKLP